MAGCQSTAPSPASPGSAAESLPRGSYTNVGATWPLKFRAHYFDAICFSTYGCRVQYGHYHPGNPSEDVLTKSSDSIPDYPNHLSAGWGPIKNFPAPAKVTWRSKDGVPHAAEIDIGEIFSDQRIRHTVKQEDAADLASSGTPGIILEVNDRTINVYMQTAIWLKQPTEPDNPLSDVQRDLIKVFSETY
ncbi:hypothetical protein ABB29_12535 [Pseudoxanthomonas dokdonensis]|uniref:Uncharacterized protein n=1 Tax=Pseudoxanthomonas dokdonensis TaxID=344882 RepID=A0A0R0CTP3_9GAMM|nr:hypothetical protein ABB29_12535 [Pseudoxanthomonas dokdonensis]